jgi:hypothetical protein
MGMNPSLTDISQREVVLGLETITNMTRLVLHNFFLEPRRWRLLIVGDDDVASRDAL